MLAFCWNFYFGHLDSTFHDGRVVVPVCVRGVRFRFVGGLGAQPSRLATVDSGGGGNEPTEEGVIASISRTPFLNQFVPLQAHSNSNSTVSFTRIIHYYKIAACCYMSKI
jgi:hypothetical protein